jgi:hypothetical protein
MRRSNATRLGIALGFVVAIAPLGNGQVVVRKHQPKVIIVPQQSQTEWVVGVMGQVRKPGTYRFASAPSLPFALEAAGGLTDATSPMVRLVRGQRVVQRVALHAAQDVLQPNDLIIVDAQPPTSAAISLPSEAADPGVQLAFLGVTDHPVIVKVHSSRARPDLIVQMLGQSADLLQTVKVIPPPRTQTTLPSNSPSTLADGTVLLFDHRLIVDEGLRDLPEIIPCALPEPDIGAYGIRRAYEERRPGEVNARSDDSHRLELPLPAAEESSPALPALPPADDVPARLSSTVSTSQPVSTVPYRSAPTIAPRTSRFSEAAPSRSAHATADAQEPAWDQIPSPRADRRSDASADDADADFDEDEAAKAGSLSLWQMFAVLAGAGLLVGAALAIRALQGFPLIAARPTRPGLAAPSTSPQERLRTEPRAPLPTPHLPIRAFAKAEATPASPAVESLALRRQRFTQLLRRELAQFEEPLALQPGIVWSSAPAGDSAVSGAESPLKDAAGPQGTASVRQIDPPHALPVSGPHHPRAASPVERALRQLQGGRA